MTNEYSYFPAERYTQVVKPGAKERIEAKLKKLPEINRLRPCKNCIYNEAHRGRYANSVGMYKHNSVGCRSCNFNHDNFEPINSGETTT